MSQCVEREEEGSDRPESPTSSCVSMKSDFTNEPGPSHTQMKRPAKPTTDDGDWTCRKCGSRNTAEDLRCRISFCNLTKIVSTSWYSITALPLSAADMRKSWHKVNTQSYRDVYVRRLVRNMSTGDPAEDINLVTDAQNIERNIYESANSLEEYWKLMDEKKSQMEKMKAMSHTSTPPLPPGDEDEYRHLMDEKRSDSELKEKKLMRMDTGMNRPAKPTTDDEDWTCRRCTYRNSAKDLTCRQSFCTITKIVSTSWDSITALPLSAADMRKSWHKDFTQSHRDRYVRYLVGDMSTGDPAENINLVTDAQKIERNMYESANSLGEYWKLMSEKSSELREKILKSMEMKQSGQMEMKSMDQRSLPSVPLGAPMNQDEYYDLMDEKRSELEKSLKKMKQSGQIEMKSMGQTSTPPPPFHPWSLNQDWVQGGEVLGSHLNMYPTTTQFNPPSTHPYTPYPPYLYPTLTYPPEQYPQPLYAQPRPWGIGEQIPQSELQKMDDIDTEGDKASDKPHEKSDWMFNPPSTPSINPYIQPQFQPQFYPLEPIKHHSITETPSPSEPTLINSNKMERQRAIDRYQRDIPYLNKTFPVLPSSTFSSYSQANREQQQPRMSKHDQVSGLSSVPSPSVGTTSALPTLSGLFPSTSLNTSSLSSSEVSHLPRKRRKEAEIEESDILPFQDVPQEVITPNMYPSVATVSPMLSSSSASQQSSHDSTEEMMSCDTPWDLSTTDHPVTESLSSVHPSLELQDETDLSSCFSGCKMGESISLPRSHSLPSLSQIPCLENKTSFRAKRSHSVNDVTLLDKTQRITPDIIVVENKESYRFHSTQAGLFQCNVTDLVFKMKTEGDVTYRTVHWDRRLLSQLRKRPSGPLFDIKGSQGSVCQLQFPHCEILSMGGGKSLYVLHVKDDDAIELIKPHVITETHVIINVNGFSLYGVVNDANSTNPIRANVSLFYTPPNGDEDSILNVLLLPKTVKLYKVIDTRRVLIGEEIYIQKPSCKLIPNKEYTLSTSPQDDSIKIEPDDAIFEVDEFDDNYVSTFEVSLEGKCTQVTLLLSEISTSICQWKRSIKLSGLALRRERVQHTLSLSPEDRLFSVRSSFIDSVSLPNLNSVVDKLLNMRVLTDAEQEEANGMQVKNEKARFVIDTVRHKGPDASSGMILFLCDIDPFLSKHLGLM